MLALKKPTRLTEPKPEEEDDDLADDDLEDPEEDEVAQLSEFTVPDTR